MANVEFSFREDASEASQEDVRKKLLEMPGVRAVARISPDAKKPALRRLWYADVADDTASALVDHLRKHDDIQSADVPAQRGLL